MPICLRNLVGILLILACSVAVGQDFDDMCVVAARQTAAASSDITAGLVARYTMSSDPTPGTYTDASGNGNTGSQATAGARPSLVTTNGKACLYFDGTSDTFTVSHSSSLATNRVTISAWICAPTWKAYGVFATKTTSSAWNDGWGIVDPTGAGTIGGRTVKFFGGSYLGARGVNAITVTGTWTHVTGTCDGSSNAFYVNGVLKDSGAASSPSSSSGNLTIGYGPGGDYFTGGMYDFRIYNRALASNEVYMVWSATK